MDNDVYNSYIILVYKGKLYLNEYFLIFNWWKYNTTVLLINNVLISKNRYIYIRL